ncbi:MAG: molybdenum cofactor biosynthesis protein MoaE [Verrucomicrobiota bacterium]
MSFTLLAEPINPGSLREKMLHPQAGAFSNYEGWVRSQNEKKEVTALSYTAYPELAQTVAETILSEAKERFDIIDCRCVHRTGLLEVGDLAVWIGVTSSHRESAFLACRYIIDNVKHRIPIWKKESYIDGTSAWIENHEVGDPAPTGLPGNLPNHSHGD